MIVISVGMQKSGTGYYFNLTNDLLVACGKQNIRELKEIYHLESLLRNYNCNIGEITPKKIFPLLKLHFHGNTFVVKSHCSPTIFLRVLLAMKILRITYIYRDPRDAIISAMDFRKTLRKDGGQRLAFTNFITVKNSLPMAKEWIKRWELWMKCSYILPVRYEDLVLDPIQELSRLIVYLSLNTHHVDLYHLVEKYHTLKFHDEHERLHFNRGIIGRYKEVMTADEQALCQQHLGAYLEKMGYQQ